MGESDVAVSRWTALYHCVEDWMVTLTVLRDRELTARLLAPVCAEAYTPWEVEGD